jgi:hypothetical protein
MEKVCFNVPTGSASGPVWTGVDCARISVRLRCLDVHRVNQWAHVNKLGV